MSHQGGQVLPLGLALLLFGTLGALVLFNTGQLATDKMRLANTADAAAYSGSLWQARALNFQSYTNRAMVANQVSIAQAVTLRSWVAYGAVTSENLATVLKPVPVINVVADGLQRGMEIVERVVSPVAQSLLSVVDAVNRGLSQAQEAMFVSTFVATPDVMRTVVDQSDQRFTINTAFSGLGLADNIEHWRSFTEGFSADDVAAMDERVQMINDSRDGFSQQRNWKFFSFWFYSTPLLRHQIRREGTTRLIRVDGADGMQWEWKAKDTMALHNRLWHWKGTKRYEVPIGWAEAFANSANASHTIEPGACDSVREMQRGNCARFLGINRQSEYLAGIGQRSLQGTQTRIAMSHYTGVQAYRSLSQATREQEQPRISLKIEVALPDDKVRSSDALGSRGQFAAPVEAPGKRLSSVSVAEVFYQRPDSDLPGQAARALEPANGYNPYYGARLSAVSAEDRLLAFGLRDSGGGIRPPAGNANGLPDNASSLADYDEADALLPGDDQDQPSDLLHDVELPDSLSDVSDFDTVVASLDQSELTRFRDDIQTRLIDALRRQVGQMLAEAVVGPVNTAVTSVEDLEDELVAMANEEMGDLVSGDAAQPYVDAVNEATAMAEALEDEFRAIRQTIVDGFQSIFEQVTAEVAERQEDLETRMQELRDDLEQGGLNEDRRESLQQQLTSLSLEKIGLYSEMRNTLAEQLRDLVNASTDLYIMRMEEAHYLVEEFLRTEEQDEISLPWLEWVEEDDVDD